MKVFEINSVCGIRSTGRICTDIADSLINEGHECIIAYGREDIPERYKIISHKIGDDFDVKVHGAISRLFDASGFGSRNSTRRLIEFIKKYDPDVIHLHNIHGYYLNIEILFDYLKFSNKRVIWTMHDCWALTGHCTNFSSVGCEKWRVGCEKCVQKKRYPSSLFLDNSKRNYIKKKSIFQNVPNLTVVTPSEWLADIVKQSFLKEYPVYVINNGIDTDTFKPCESNFRERFALKNKFVILGVSSTWDRLKGFDDFLKLAKIITTDYRIVLIGLNEKQIANLPNNIVGIARTNSTLELAQIYSSADVFVNFTYEDNYPTVNLEAQACGTPALTYNTGGSVESVPERNIIPAGDIEGAFEKIKNGDYDGNLRSGINLDKKSFTEQYIGLYLNTIDR